MNIKFADMKRMRRFISLCVFTFFSLPVFAQWQKVNQDVDYVWGPFKIYTLSLFSETGKYEEGERPLMFSLTYAKPVDGRDFAISLARSWSNLGMTLLDQENKVARLKKIMPNIQQNDVLSYIALEDKGYFILNNTVIPEEFNHQFNEAVVAVWLDPRVEIGRKLLNKLSSVHQAYKSDAVTTEKDEKALASLSHHLDGISEIIQQDKTAFKSEVKKENPLSGEMDSQETKSQERDYPNPEIQVLPPYDPLMVDFFRG